MNELYNQLLTSPRSALGDTPDERDKVVNTINRFLDEYPKTLKPTPDDPWINLPVKTIFKKTIETMIDIINDVSTILSQSNKYSAAEFRRQLVNVFLREDRRLYVGLWIIFISIVLYFIDAAA